MKKIIKNNIKLIIGIIIGTVISGTAVYAATTIASSNVTYTSNSQSTVQGALDTLYTRANKWVNPNDMGIPTRYLFGKPTSSSPTTPPSGKNVYVGYYADDQYGVCIKSNGTQHCFRYNNWIAEAKHIQSVFSGADDSCSVYWSYVHCKSSDLVCDVGSNGGVNCNDYGTKEHCYVLGDGSVDCY